MNLSRWKATFQNLSRRASLSRLAELNGEKPSVVIYGRSPKQSGIGSIRVNSEK